jgi:hypothetical protein
VLQKYATNGQFRAVLVGDGTPSGVLPMTNRSMVSRTSETGVRWCRFRGQKGNSGLAGIPDALNEGSPYRGVCLRRSKAVKGTSLSGFCTIVTHREGIAQVVYAYIGTRKLCNSGRTSGVSLPIRVRISHHLFAIDGKQLRNAYSASAWNIAEHMSCNS